MGPKKGKDAIDDNFWRTSIEQAVLDDFEWTVKVVMIDAAPSEQDRIYLNKFESFAAQERRFVIKNICKTELNFMVNQLGAEKKVKDDSLRVFEEGQLFLKDKKDIPSDVLALIIKHLIIKMKDDYLFIKRQKNEVKEGIRRESATMIDPSEVRGTVSVKVAEPEVINVPTKKGKKGESEVANSLPELDEDKKYNTILRVKGEEWRDKLYIDDYPLEGPSIYVAVTGFLDPYLSDNLVKIGVPLIAIVQVRIDSTLFKVPSNLSPSTKRGQSQTEILVEKSLLFWQDLQALRTNKNTTNDLKNTAFFVFCPPYWTRDTLSGDAGKIYDEICFLLYDVQDLSRQHSHYLENIEVVDIPEVDDKSTNKKIYDNLIEDLPLESVSVYIVLDCLLQTVSKVLDTSTAATVQNSSFNSTPKMSDGHDKLKKAENLVSKVFDTLVQTDKDEKSYRTTYGEEYENYKDPIIVDYGDLEKYSTFHVHNINMYNTIYSMLINMPINLLWKNQHRPVKEFESKLNFHVSALLSFFERKDVETNELNRLLHILACRKIYNNRCSLKKIHKEPCSLRQFKKVYLKRSVLAEPMLNQTLVKINSSTTQSCISMTKIENEISNLELNDSEKSHIGFIFDCPDISELVSAAEINAGTPIGHMIDDYEYFEDFSGISSFQMLLEAFNTFNCVDYKYCEVTDCIIMMFFNNHDNEGISRDEWRSHLITPLCLQDFFDYVLEEQYNWIKEQETVYDEQVNFNKVHSKDNLDHAPLKPCIHNLQVDTELIMEGSLKHQEIAKIEESSVALTIETTKTPSKKTASPSTTDKEIRTSQRNKSPLTSTPKDFLKANTESLKSIEKELKPFIGYALGDRRVEAFGKDSVYFSKDGTRVSSLYTLFIPTNYEYITLNVTPGKGQTEFWLHKLLGHEKDNSNSIRITSKNRSMLNLLKRSYHIPIQKVAECSDLKIKESNKQILTKSQPDFIEETRNFYSFVITWPNGLIIESVYESNSNIISHIKQFYMNPNILDEDMRCVSLNGEVVIFKTSGFIEVLKPDSSFIIIKKCEKRLVPPIIPDDLISQSSDKSKKNKEKPLKSTSKSSKATESEINNPNSLPPIYELVINEFETIETNGVREKWVDNIQYFIEKLLIKTATDFCLAEVYSKRMDGTNILINKDGKQVVTFPDGTRLITTIVEEGQEIYPEWTEDEIAYFQQSAKASKLENGDTSDSEQSNKVEEEEVKQMFRNDGYVSVQLIYTVEHTHFATVTIDKSQSNISVDSPNQTSVVVDFSNNYDIKLDKATNAQFDGENLHIDYEACPDCQSFTTCNINLSSDFNNNEINDKPSYWLEMKDSYCNKIVINKEGFMKTTDESCSEENLFNLNEEISANECQTNKDIETLDKKSMNSVTEHGKCRYMYQANSFRFFVLNRDLTSSELVHRARVDDYKARCRWKPWCSINQYDTFGDYRSLISILKPLSLTETELWYMDSKLANKPHHLRYKDLKEDCGKGFYHWMRPYERFIPQPRKPENALPPRQPKAFVLSFRELEQLNPCYHIYHDNRTLEQQWDECKRETLKGAKELIHAILRYRTVMESECETMMHMPIVDPRTEVERRNDDVLYNLAHNMYEDLKNRQHDDMLSRAKPDITTKPKPTQDSECEEEEFEEESVDELKVILEERESTLKAVADVAPLSPKLDRYWRQRAEERKEEEFYRYLLRQGTVPPYFRNVLGGTFWWQLNNVAEEAVSLAERRKMKCTCPQEDTEQRAEETDDRQFL